jgi:hypothetical protein
MLGKGWASLRSGLTVVLAAGRPPRHPAAAGFEGKGSGRRPVKITVDDPTALDPGLLLLSEFVVRGLAEDASAAAGAPTSVPDVNLLARVHAAPRPAALKLLHSVEATAPGSGSSWTSTRSTHLTH